MRRRPAVLALQGAALAALVGGTTAFVALDKTVTLSVDGESREVRSFARTVGDVLDKEGVEVGPHDSVVPAPDTALADGQDVTVAFGRLLSLEVDGKTRQVWVTADTVDEALDQLGVRAEGAFVSVSRSRSIGRDGMALELRTPKRITFRADGKEHERTTTQETVGAALREAGLRLAKTDLTSVPLDLPVRDGQTVNVRRVVKRTVTETRPVSFDTVERDTDDLYTGQTRVAEAGRDGVRTLTIRETLLDGKMHRRKVSDDEVTREPVDRVVLVGTAARPAPEPTASESSSERSSEPARSSRSSSSGSSGSSGSSSSGSSSSGSSSSGSSSSGSSSSGGLNWGALAECESGGDPTIVSSNGLYYGLYQFSVATWQSVGGSGLPSQASPSEQTMRAQMLYDRAGRGQWPTCGRYL